MVEEDVQMISRKGFYGNVDLQFEMIHQHLHRETFFLPYIEVDGKLQSTPPIRWLNASALKFLKLHWDRYDFLEKPMNLYFSLATYKDFPTFSYNWRTKSQQQKVWLEAFKDYVAKYDLFIETDSQDLKESYADSLAIADFLNKYKMVYHVKFSGSKGFHFIIPYDEFAFLGLKVFDNVLESNVKDFGSLLLKCPVPLPDGEHTFDVVMLFKLIALRIKTLLACITVDTSVQDVKRVCKTGYSMDVKSGLVAYPLDDNQLKNFTKDMVTPVKVLSYKNHKRGLLWRHLDVPKQEREQRILEMLRDLGIYK